MSSYATGPLPLKQKQKPPYSVEAPDSVSVPGETRPRRNPAAKDGLIDRPASEVDTLFALLKRTAEKYGDRPGIGSRRLVKVHKEIKKVSKVVDGETREVDKEWTVLELSDYSYLTWAEYLQSVLDVASGLRKLGLTSGDRTHIFAATRFVWLPFYLTFLTPAQRELAYPRPRLCFPVHDYRDGLRHPRR